MSYGDRDVLTGVDLDVHRGELLALLGPNGAGKTTTLEILEGFRRRSGGEVRVLGHDPELADDACRDRVGIVMQSWRDHARWQVRDLITHLSRYYTAPADPDQLLELVGLSTQAEQESRTLSGGQRRRLDVALGLIGRPEVLFLDEPTAGFDPAARTEFHALLEQLRRASPLTVLLTTHDLAEAERLADRIAILISGRVTAAGTAAELAAVAEAQAEVRWYNDEGCQQRRRTGDPSRLVWQLHHDFAGPIPGLEVRRPTLEDTYLAMVGR
jgi:ABC-2 type transport system ATP-binding protein